MIRFECDYLEGAHPRVIEALTRTNEEQTPGYGVDAYSKKAADLIRGACAAPEADVQFLIGGTLTNTVVIAAVLRPHQGVLSADTGHIAVHETGAIEMNSHKVLTLPSSEGKISAASVEAALVAHYSDATAEHTVQPGMVYLSHPTEYGTLYTKAELTAISEVCHRFGIPLYLDGARLGYGVMAEGTDLTMPDIAALCDAFYVGGTKVGALFGEALVIPNPAIAKDIRYLIKQHGSLLAKGRLLGLQFIALFEDGLYFDIAARADRLALRLRDGIVSLGYTFLFPSVTNQQFPILPDRLLERLSEKYSYSFWQRYDEAHSVVRFCTSFMTPEASVEALLADLERLTRELGN